MLLPRDRRVLLLLLWGLGMTFLALLPLLDLGLDVDVVQHVKTQVPVVRDWAAEWTDRKLWEWKASVQAELGPVEPVEGPEGETMREEKDFETTNEDDGEKKEPAKAGILVEPVEAASVEAGRGEMTASMVKVGKAAKGSLRKGKTPSVQLSEVETESCPVASCRFLFPVKIGEQETKAAEHLFELGKLALLLNRTLVLPNTEKSYFRACWKTPFAFYYDPSYFTSHGISTISQSDYLAWIHSRSRQTTAQEITFLLTNDPKEEKLSHTIEPGPHLPETDNKGFRKFNCLAPIKEKKHDFSRFRSAKFVYVNSRVRTRQLDRIMRSLRTGYGAVDATEGETADTLLVNYNLRRLMFTEPMFRAYAPAEVATPGRYTHLPYATQWMDLSKQLVKNLQPFITVQWRTEEVIPPNLSLCATSMMALLRTLLLQNPAISNVYIATDYPLEFLRFGLGTGHPHSGTYRPGKTHDQAFRFFLSEFAALAQEFSEHEGRDIRLTSYVEEEKRLHVPGGRSLLDVDVSLIGMLDRAVATHASLFVAGQRGERQGEGCGRRSSYTESVVKERRRAHERDPGKVWNSVERFGLPEGQGISREEWWALEAEEKEKKRKKKMKGGTRRETIESGLSTR